MMAWQIGLGALALVAILFYQIGYIQRLVLQVLQQQQQILDKENQLIMTVQQVKDRIASAQTAILAKSAEETEELKLIIGNNSGGATPAQLDEIGAAVEDLEAEAFAAIGAISDNVAGTDEPNPNPQP